MSSKRACRKPSTSRARRRLRESSPIVRAARFRPWATPYGLDVIVDYSLDMLGDVYFEAGDHRTLVHVTDDQFALMTEDALHGSFSSAN